MADSTTNAEFQLPHDVGDVMRPSSSTLWWWVLLFLAALIAASIYFWRRRQKKFATTPEVEPGFATTPPEDWRQETARAYYHGLWSGTLHVGRATWGDDLSRKTIRELCDFIANDRRSLGVERGDLRALLKRAEWTIFGNGLPMRDDASRDGQVLLQMKQVRHNAQSYPFTPPQAGLAVWNSNSHEQVPP